jgi:hypothetical protein
MGSPRQRHFSACGSGRTDLLGYFDQSEPQRRPIVMRGEHFTNRIKTMSQAKNEAASQKAANDNPKLDPNPPTNMEKDPENWVSGDDPMTGAQASYLKTLSEEAGDPDAYDENLTKAEASRRIDALKEELGLR